LRAICQDYYLIKKGESNMWEEFLLVGNTNWRGMVDLFEIVEIRMMPGVANQVQLIRNNGGSVQVIGDFDVIAKRLQQIAKLKRAYIV
jgi:hypothetical protein